MTDRELDTMNTAFIDLICCALGSVLMLMLFVACLVRAVADRSDRPAAGGAARAALGPADGGPADAPAEPLIVTARWRGTARWPVQLVAYPPAADRDEVAPQDAAKLSEEAGQVRVGGRDTYFGFFTRRQDRDGTHELKLVVPRSRSAAADAARATSKPARPLDRTHAGRWRFEVVQSATELGRTRRAALLTAADACRDLEVHVADGDRKRLATLTAPEAVGRVVGLDLPAPDRRAAALARVWRATVLPELVRVAGRAGDIEASAAGFVPRVDAALAAANAGLGGAGPPLGWDDLATGPADQAVPGAAAWLAAARGYAAVFAGSAADGGPVAVEVTVTAFPGGAQRWRSDGQPRVALKPDRPALFAPPQP